VTKNFAQILDKVQEGLPYCTYTTPTKGNKMIKFQSKVSGYTITFEHNCYMCCDGKNQGEIMTTNIKAKDLIALDKEIKSCSGIGKLIGTPIPTTWALS